MMKRFCLVIGIMLTAVSAVLGQVPRTMSYQGVLTDADGNPVPDGTYNFVFRLYLAESGGDPIWEETQMVVISGGLFDVILGQVNPLDLPFDRPYYLGISVDGGSEMSPRIPLSASPYSLTARTVADSAVTGEKIASGQVVRSVNGLTDEVFLAAEGGATITTRGDTIVINAGGGSGPDAWSLTGNAGTNPSKHFLGTTDNQALEVRVNSQRALRIEPGSTPNLIAGFSGNSVTAGVVGATIAGGGAPDNGFGGPDNNRVTDDYGTVGGGWGNQAGDDAGTTSDRSYATVGGGRSNTASNVAATVGGGDSNIASGGAATVSGGRMNAASGVYATVGGGWRNIASRNEATVGGGNSNTASGLGATVGGGFSNTASGSYATVGGGSRNTASGFRATVGGGFSNTANGNYATVPGGSRNTAGGDYSFAAGRRAKADHNGTFVWADAQDADFVSTGPNQFLIRAAGGVGIGTNAPQAALDVAANSTTSRATLRLHETANDYARLEFSNTNTARRWHIAGYIGGTQAGDRLNIWNSGQGDILSVTGDGKVGIGTRAPQNVLHVVGFVPGITGPSLERHVVQIENTETSSLASVLALKVGTTAFPNVHNNFITFFDGNGNSVGAIQGDGSGGVTLAGPGSDYAEWLPLRNPAESIQPGDIVAWTPRGITLRTGEALRLMVVSSQPIVTGNAPMNEDRSGWAPVAFVGQVPVRVRGPVQAGDFILPSGKNDGSGVAVSPDELQADQVGQVVGRALESAEGAGLHRVKVLVGLPHNVILQVLLRQRDARLAQQQARLDALEARLEALEREVLGRATPAAVDQK